MIRARQIGAAVLILIVCWALVQQVRFGRYVAETLPRDAAQEACGNARSAVITLWVSAVRRDLILETAILSETPASGITRAQIDRIVASRQDMHDVFDRNPLPAC